MSELKLQRLSSLKEQDITHCDFSFDISQKIAEPITQLANDGPFTTVPTSKTTKKFEFDETEFEDIDGKSSVLFALTKDEQIYAYILARKGWNNMVHVEYICVDKSIRRGGHAKRLFDAVLEWTKEIGLNCIRVEAQANNIASCKFWRNAGFAFGGYDELLYRCEPEVHDEAAVFFYKFLN